MAERFRDEFVAEVSEGLENRANWVRIAGTVGADEILVDATNDRIQDGVVEVATTHRGVYRCTHANLPTGDQQAAFSVNGVNNNISGVMLRMPTSNADTGYIFAIRPGEADTGIRIIRRVAGVDTQLIASQTVAQLTTYLAVARVLGAGATVRLEFEIVGFDPVNFDDTDAARLLSGTMGAFLQHGGGSGSRAWLDTIVVDDLVAGGGEEPTTSFRFVGPRIVGYRR